MSKIFKINMHHFIVFNPTITLPKDILIINVGYSFNTLDIEYVGCKQIILLPPMSHSIQERPCLMISMHKNKRETIARLWSNLQRKGDVKCYCPCKMCKGLKTQRYLITIVEKHCRQHGHIEGGNKFCSLVCILIIYKIHKT